jgi:hypothetical protein
VRDLWARNDLGISNQITVALPAHGAALFQAEHR